MFSLFSISFIYRRPAVVHFDRKLDTQIVLISPQIVDTLNVSPCECVYACVLEEEVKDVRYDCRHFQVAASKIVFSRIVEMKEILMI